MFIPNLPAVRPRKPAWNKGRIVGQKRPLMPKHVWAIRVRLELAEKHRDLALFNTAIDSKLRGCDLVSLKVADVYAANQIKERTSILQSKTQKPVRFELTEGTRKSLERWLADPMMIGAMLAPLGLAGLAGENAENAVGVAHAGHFRVGHHHRFVGEIGGGERAFFDARRAVADDVFHAHVLEPFQDFFHALQGQAARHDLGKVQLDLWAR